MFKILIVEDDVTIKNHINDHLQKWQFETTVIDDFSTVFEKFMDVDPHLILMDITLPQFDGFHWCKKIREVSKCPIIFISSRDTQMDMIMALNLGGDDYIQKPFTLEFLTVKINTLLRRIYDYQDTSSNILKTGDAYLNLSNSSLVHGDKSIELTKNEVKILHILMENHGQIVSREIIMRKLWEHESFVDDNTLTVNINRLRKKCVELDLIDFIQTKKGQGYIVL